MTRRRNGIVDPANFESFVDVVCNLIGGLLLVAAISVVGVQDPVFEVFTPVEDVRMQDSTAVKFAVTSQGIYPLDEDSAFERFYAAEKRNPKSDRLAVETDFCEWTLHKSLRRLVCKLKERAPAITDRHLGGLADLVRYAKKKDVDSSKSFAYFFVSPDDTSFRLFRMARKALWKDKIRVGWGPVDPQKGIVFGGISSGVPLRPQD